MSARDVFTNVTIILSVMAVGALIETVVPMFAAGAWRLLAIPFRESEAPLVPDTKVRIGASAGR